MVSLVRDSGQLWFIDPTAAKHGESAPRASVDSGDRLVLKSGNSTAEVLFAHCPAPDRSLA